MEYKDLKPAYEQPVKEFLALKRDLKNAGKSFSAEIDGIVKIRHHDIPFVIAQEHADLQKQNLELRLANDVAGLARNQGKGDIPYQSVMAEAKKLMAEITADVLKKYPELAGKGKGR